MKKLTLSLALLAALAGCNNKADTPTPAAPKAAVAKADANQLCTYLSSDQHLLVGDELGTRAYCSTRRGGRLVLQDDGNLVFYVAGTTAPWATNTVGRGGNFLIMQTDGNLVLYNSNTGEAVWNSETQGHPGAYLKISARDIYSPTLGGYVDSSSYSLELYDANNRYLKTLSSF